MTVTRRELLKLAGSAGVMSLAPAFARAAKLEKTKVAIAVGGKALVYYLPLTIAEVRGYFKDEGLDVTIADFAGGAKALQAVVGGSADVVSGAFEHSLNLQSKGQYYRNFVLQGRAPLIGSVSPPRPWRTTSRRPTSRARRSASRRRVHRPIWWSTSSWPSMA